MNDHSEEILEALNTIAGYMKDFRALSQQKRATAAATLRVLAKRLGEPDPVPQCLNIDKDCKTCVHPQTEVGHQCPGFSKELCPLYQPDIKCKTCGGK